VKRVRGITITSRAAIDVGDSGLGSGAARAEGKRRKLGVARDAEDTQGIQLEKASLVKVAAATMNKVTVGASGSGKEDRMSVRNGEPDKAVKADEVDVEAGRVTDEVTRRRESEVEAGVDG
jgi:hypothetical protein